MADGQQNNKFESNKNVVDAVSDYFEEVDLWNYKNGIIILEH